MGARRPFAITGARPHYAPDLPFKLEHLLLDVIVDPQAKTLSGTATHRVRTVAADQAWLTLDQVGLEDRGDEGRRKACVKFEIEGNSLRTQAGRRGLARGPRSERYFEISVRYSLHDPRRGMYFTGPDAHHPRKRHQVWSPSQDEDSRYWFPSFDYPNQKATSEVIATVPKGFTAVSNGALLSRKDEVCQPAGPGQHDALSLQARDAARHVPRCAHGR